MMTLVWALDLPDSEKIVLLALADSANDEGHCWPSMRSLTIKCSKSDRTIQGSIRRLVDAGHLTRREVPGKGCNYSVHPRKDIAPEVASPPKGTTQTPEAASDKPSRTTNTEAKASLQRVVDSWNEMAAGCGLPKVRVLDASRRQSMRLRLKEHGEEGLLEAIGMIRRSPWLMGVGRDSKWRPDFDFLLTPSKLRKILEGSYGAEVEKQARTIPARIRQYEETAAFYRKIGRDRDADEALKIAARLRRPGNGDGTARSLGSVVVQIAGAVR
jgi:hypothetical protein